MRQLLRVAVFAVLLGGGCLAFAQAEESWRDEFERICGKTGEAGQMGEAELTKLISESERLREKIESGNDPDRKVYLFRVRKCRDFFVFMKDTVATAQRP